MTDVQFIDQLLKANSHDKTSMTFIERIGATVLGIKPSYLITVNANRCVGLCERYFTGRSPVAFAGIKGREGRR